MLIWSFGIGGVGRCDIPFAIFPLECPSHTSVCFFLSFLIKARNIGLKKFRKCGVSNNTSRIVNLFLTLRVKEGLDLPAIVVDFLEQSWPLFYNSTCALKPFFHIFNWFKVAGPLSKCILHVKNVLPYVAFKLEVLFNWAHRFPRWFFFE